MVGTGGLESEECRDQDGNFSLQGRIRTGRVPSEAMEGSFSEYEYLSVFEMAKMTIDLASPLAYTPAETAELICRAGVKKGRSRPDKVLLSGISGGCILAFGCAVSLTALTAPWYQENATGLIKLIGAIVFPLGLVTVILTGADLFTSTNLVG